MNDQPQRTIKAASAPMGFGPPSMAVHAPEGAVSRKDRERAGRTALRREGRTIQLDTELPGSVMLQRRGADGTWETIQARSASRLGRTKIDLPDDDASSPATFRVVFSPRNANIAAWSSENIAT